MSLAEPRLQLDIPEQAGRARSFRHIDILSAEAYAPGDEIAAEPAVEIAPNDSSSGLRK